jgi:hypothetical protein
MLIETEREGQMSGQVKGSDHMSQAVAAIACFEAYRLGSRHMECTLSHGHTLIQCMYKNNHISTCFSVAPSAIFDYLQELKVLHTQEMIHWQYCTSGMFLVLQVYFVMHPS